MALITPTLRLASVGFLATAMAFGPARMGFGLFLPVFREDFALSTTVAGLIASGGFLAFLLALPVTTWLGARAGQRAPVVAGALSAAAGFAVVSMASGSASLALGVALAGASAGFCWTPFNDAAERIVPAKARPGALSAVSTGTTIGISAAGALFIGVTFGVFEWRAAWIVFALYGVFVALAAGFGLPETARSKALADDAVPGLLRRVALPLYAAALCFGATNAIYLSFAADRVVNAGGLAGLPDTAASAVIFLGYGICGVIGLATGWIEARIGLAPLLAAIFAAFVASLALVALIPGSWAGVVVSAGLHGAAVMTISAILSFWSLRLFPGRGSLGFTATLVGAATGSVLGPALAGALADAAGGQVAFLAAAAVPLAAALAFACRSSDSLS